MAYLYKTSVLNCTLDFITSTVQNLNVISELRVGSLGRMYAEIAAGIGPGILSNRLYYILMFMSYITL